MALILPPDLAYTSFVSVADSQTYIEEMTLDSAAWNALSVADAEVYLRIATRRIEDGIDPDATPLDATDLPECLAEATSLIAVHDLVNGISSGSATVAASGAIKKEQVGTIVQEYYDTKSNSDTYTSLIPAAAQACLDSIGYVFPSGISGVGQITLGRS